MSIKNLDPQIVWKNFYELTQIPRPSKKEALAVEYMYNWGKAHGLETIKDEVGNIVIRKPATPGLENLKGVILQGHIDMVPQKNADTVHDFEKDPIQTYIDGDWVKAKGTTLGADNGLGVAMGMAVLESDDLKHGPVELLVTVDEETGMTGANALKPGLLQGDILINLDSETEGELYVGCAGGLDASAYATYTAAEPQEGWLCYSLKLGLIPDFPYCIAFFHKIKEVFCCPGDFFHAADRQRRRQQGQAHQFHRRLRPELPHRLQHLGKKSCIEGRAPRAAGQQKPPQLPGALPQQKRKRRHTHRQHITPVQPRRPPPESQPERPQHIIHCRRANAQQNGPQQQLPFRHISRKCG